MKNPKQTIFHAHFGTMHFSFDAYGSTEKECMAAMSAGIKLHCHQAGVEYDPEYWNEVNVVEVSLGSCWIDHDRELK